MSANDKLADTFWSNVNVSRSGAVWKRKFEAVTVGAAIVPVTVFVADAGAPVKPPSSVAWAQYVYVPAASEAVETLTDHTPLTLVVVEPTSESPPAPTCSPATPLVSR